ncbi:MAG: endolytic transglycosylase MltG [Phaeodactylibacter sp.]|nr:endolytic transglycosylase MltG [Phaeodactylibacter sp.]MCB9303997.1 endolytic transglycosylase MltG [Lewinellaceae bacterium]HQU58971.1 endolytic transglycosylase MltG [Saprospiraceae bacterium]
MKRTISLVAAAIILVLLVAALFVYKKFIAGPGVPKGLATYYVEIPTNSSFEEVLGILREDGFVKDEGIFRMLSERMGYKRSPMRAGRFELKPGWNTIEMIRQLRSGEQAPVKLVLTNERLIENVAAKAARFIEPDSLQIWSLFQNEAYLDSIGYTSETLMSLFIPNTYEFYWNTSPRSFMSRMIREHDAFWEKNGRLEKARSLNMTPAEVYTLASIVEKETLRSEEKPRVAGAYLNRLKIGMRLQADPTCVFATRDFDTPRVTDYHTKFDSPYNTYLYAGLPPGPISMASISSIDAVLNAEDHDYLYFCAVGDGSGFHAFAKTLAAHNQNAARYRENLKQRGLR